MWIIHLVLRIAITEHTAEIAFYFNVTDIIFHSLKTFIEHPMMVRKSQKECHSVVAVSDDSFPIS